jgi:hypothetical protein
MSIACSSQQAEVNRLRSENMRLKAELEALKTGPEVLWARAESLEAAGSLDEAKATLNPIVSRHRSAPEAESARQRLSRVEAMIGQRQRAAERARAAEVAAEKARLDAATTRMTKSHDEVKGVTWYRDRNSPRYVNSRSSIYLYFGKPDNGVPNNLRFVVQYVAEDWLFVERLILKVDDGVMTIAPGHFGMETDNGVVEGEAMIWEWLDSPAGPEEVRIARAVAASKKTVLRYEGRQYYRDRVVTSDEKTALRNVLDAYVALGGHVDE